MTQYIYIILNMKKQIYYLTIGNNKSNVVFNKITKRNYNSISFLNKVE